jgi:hypothetical protein
VPTKQPILQLAIEFATFDEALAMAPPAWSGHRLGSNVGTPRIASEGLTPIGKMVRALNMNPVGRPATNRREAAYFRHFLPWRP